MMFKLFEIVWDSDLTANNSNLPQELIVDAHQIKDETEFKLNLMDQLDADYNAIVQDFKWEEI